MSERAGAFPIGRNKLEPHFEKVNEHLRHIYRGDGVEEGNLVKLMQGIGSSADDLLAPEAQSALEGIKNGLASYYEVYAILEDKIRRENLEFPYSDKRHFLGAYSLFAASSYIQHDLEALLGENEPFEAPGNLKFKFDLEKDENLRAFLARYFGIINTAKRDKVLKEGSDVARASYEFFKIMKEQAVEQKSSINQKLVDLVNDSEFRILDRVSIKGFEATHQERESHSKIEFVPVLPYQVAGNVLAKKEMLRDMDRMGLYDPEAKQNPVIKVGGISWSVLYDGLPGTGKSSLFKMGLTRLRQRCEQVNAFRKARNMPPIAWAQIAIDQSIKDEYYGKTGKNLLEKLSVTKKTEGIYVITTDDIDLLVAGDRGASSGGSDKDILNILMQYADGINTVIRGNVQWWAATNDATSMDAALRQRFLARYSVDGPQEWYDFADIFGEKLRTWIESGIVKVSAGEGYRPNEMRKTESANSSPGFLSAVGRKLKGGITLREIGELCRQEKDKNERFTGRAVHAVSEAVKKRINDYEIPEDWYQKPDTFVYQPFERRVEMLRELCVKIDGDTIVEEIRRYAESEGRYATDRLDSDVKRTVHNMRVQEKAIKQFTEEK